MENFNIVLRHSLKRGTILGLAISLFTFLLYIFEIHMFSIIGGIMIGLIIYGGEIAYSVISMKSYRNSIGGVVDFKQLFVYGIIMLLVASFVNLIFTYFLYNIIDPDFLNRQVQYFTDDMSKYFPEGGDKLDEAVAKIQESVEQIKNPISSISKIWIGPVVLSLILSLIIKKDINE